MLLSGIYIYPIKSLGGISLDSAKVEPTGLEFDRRWMLVSENNEFITQRNFPKMATLQVGINNRGLIVSDKENKIQIPFAPAPAKLEKVNVWSSRIWAKVYENEINQWFADVLETNCKLVWMPKESQRKVNYFYAIHKTDTVSFADAYPFLIVGESSLNDLNSKLEKKIPINRFRPNLVFNNSEPFAEDTWKKIKIGNTVFHSVKPCSRCVITTIEQETGYSGGKEPLKTLASFRIPKGSLKKKILFGQYLIAENFGENVQIGDMVEIIELKN